MSRKGTKEQNDISLIIGNLPKRLQNKIAASCSNNDSSNSHAAEDAENAEPKPAAKVTSRPVLSRPKENNVGIAPMMRANAPVLDTSGCSISRSLDIGSRDVGIPGILRISANPATAITAADEAKRENTRARRRRRTNSARMHQEPIPLSPLPLSRVRLTTDHPAWFEQLLNMPNAKIIVQLYDQLMVLQQRNLILINWKNFCYLHGQLLDAFCSLLLDQLKFVCEHKVDAFFWKLLFYNVREYLRRQNTDVTQSHTLLLIEQTAKFYRVTYDKLMAKYISVRCESAVKVVAQRLLICLGDLSRYRANHLQLTDFAEACKYYQRAQELVPSNGAPYNQLAIIAIYNHKRFEAVYYYMRSLLSSNAIQSAKESLLDLFDEIRRKYEELEMKQSPMHCVANKPKKSKQMRSEVWIYPDGMRCLHRTDFKGKTKNKSNIVELNCYDELPPEDLLPKIVALYLYLVGKLFTATDIECMYQQLGKLQIQLSAALKFDNLLSRTKLLKMVALNVFVLEHNKLKANRREMRYHSFNFANSFFGLMLSKVNQLLASLTEDSTELESFTDKELTRVNTYLQFIKIYTHWLTINVDLWEPVRTEDHSFIDCWAELRILFDHIESIYSKFDKESESSNKLNVVLDEDIVLSGFQPLGRDLARECSQRSSERAQFIERIRKIAQFQSIYLQHEESLQLPLNDSFTIEDLNTAMQVALKDFDMDSCGDSIPLETSVSEQDQIEEVDMMCSSTANADVTQLCKLKKQLEAKAKVKQICNSKLEEILKLVDSKLYIEVRPRLLLPDTNCFIDCLEDIEKLSMEFKRYTLIIPLTVVKELDGLSKGVKLDSYRSSKQTQRIHHFDEVSTRAKKSLEFIRSAKNNVKCVTTKGSVISASLFALVEEEYASNDDKILATAVAASKNASTEQCRDGKCFIRTELVLITTDRNLRVKALARNLAVSALDEFLQWAKDCREST
ncbi:telomerase-binding protein EST1A isoform X2 [Drosophila grimshawi]|uniref:telomerase-binding protein EST1A isoform X2 n=1 Tax=Drosophila grimshawi TaxID=7222 RepID=UPI000C86EEB5|nr:telomerase-binding protein EST1A isoform X2 [Drosophila grimshawi]